MHLRDLMDPEETVGNISHDRASGPGADVRFPEAAAPLAAVRSSLAFLFRTLGGLAGVELGEAPATIAHHRRSATRKLASGRDREWVAAYDGQRVSLPPVMAIVEERELNPGAYFWLTGMAALTDTASLDLPGEEQALDWAQINLNAIAADLAFQHSPGLCAPYRRMAALCAKMRPDLARPAPEAEIERAIRGQLCGPTQATMSARATRGYMRLRRSRSGFGSSGFPAVQARQSMRLIRSRRRPPRQPRPAARWGCARINRTARMFSSSTGSNRFCPGLNR